MKLLTHILAFILGIVVTILVYSPVPKDCPKCTIPKNSTTTLPACDGSYKVEMDTANDRVKSFECKR